VTRKAERISCHQCKYFYVTWDSSFPYGCKANGFKGKTMPSLTVLQAAGHPCLSFEPKDQQLKPERKTD
jgi:hypothetical protein